MTLDDWLDLQRLAPGAPHGLECVGREKLQVLWDAAQMAKPSKFAGWFTEPPSAMSYRMWEQGGATPEPGDVALYEA
jgi:hypothetical protein